MSIIDKNKKHFYILLDRLADKDYIIDLQCCRNHNAKFMINSTILTYPNYLSELSVMDRRGLYMNVESFA